MIKALLVEIKNSITKSFFHLLRFGGLLLIPFVYGFSYIYAFYDPFENVNQVKVSLITEKNDILGDAFGKQLSKNNQIKMGDLSMTMKMEHIYAGDKSFEEVKKESYATIKIGDLSSIDQDIQQVIDTALTNSALGKVIHAATLAANIGLQISGGLHKIIDMDLNYKKNYLLAFGVDVGSSLYQTVQFVEKMMIQALQDPAYIRHVAAAINKPEADIAAALKGTEKHGLSTIQPIKVEAHMGEHAKYGYGLAPFFLSVAMWIGGMVMTFAVHRKIYDKSISAGKRYFAKWLILAFGNIIQASILMLGLYFIGFKELGGKNLTQLWIGAIISGLIFSTIIQAIRFSIHNRTIGILLTIIFLVVQMASGGGLFPVETQSNGWQAINKIVPMGRTVTILRELSFNTNWSNVFIELGYLLLWLLILPVGIVINHYRTVKIYNKQNWELPPYMAYRENIRQAKRTRRKGGANV